MSPYPKAYFNYKGESIKVLQATVLSDATTEAVGTVVDDNLSIACGLGTVVRLEQLQRAGKGVVNRADFLRGFPIKKGEKF